MSRERHRESETDRQTESVRRTTDILLLFGELVYILFCILLHDIKFLIARVNEHRGREEERRRRGRPDFDLGPSHSLRGCSLLKWR
jgi:hypothetical protein